MDELCIVCDSFIGFHGLCVTSHLTLLISLREKYSFHVHNADEAIDTKRISLVLYHSKLGLNAEWNVSLKKHDAVY